MRAIESRDLSDTRSSERTYTLLDLMATYAPLTPRQRTQRRLWVIVTGLVLVVIAFYCGYGLGRHAAQPEVPNQIGASVGPVKQCVEVHQPVSDVEKAAASRPKTGLVR